MSAFRIRFALVYLLIDAMSLTVIGTYFASG